MNACTGKNKISSITTSLVLQKLVTNKQSVKIIAYNL